VRVATWNVNSVVRRLNHLLDWLERKQPAVVALQELKATADAFPAEALREAGYNSLVVGERSWNGVALLARRELVPIIKALPGDASDKQARYVEAAVDGVLYGCLYLPNGNPQPGPKFAYKLQWFERLKRRAAELLASGHPVVLLGDWNVVPTDSDIYKPDSWRKDALLQPEPRQAFAELLAQGWTDVIRKVYPDQVPYTFWDFFRKHWERDAGLRIDHILVNAQLQVVDAGVDREERGRDHPSDHAPVWAELQLRKAGKSSKAAPSAAKTPASKKSRPAAGAPGRRTARRPAHP
jgi:exodeoxyribonuclease III